jgi:hypothetical protein
MAKKTQLPVWAQMGLVWFVLSTLSAFGLLYLRASETIGDRVFQPLAPMVCAAGERLETTYVQKTRLVGNRGETVYRGGRQQQVFSLDAATCIAADGSERQGASFVPTVWSVFALGWGVLVLVGWMRQTR